MLIVKHISYLMVFIGVVLSFSSVSAELDSRPGIGFPEINGLVIGSLENQPIPKELKELSKKQHRQMKGRGYADASEEEVAVFERYSLKKNKKYIKQMEDITGKLAMQPAVLMGTPFDKGKFIGVIVGGGYVEGGRTGIARLYQIPKLGLVMLDENDYVASRGGIMLAKEFINEEINGHPAVLMVKESLSGKALTELIWVTDRKIFTLSTAKKLLKKDDKMELFMSLARSIY